VRFVLGPHEVQLVMPRNSAGVIAEHLRTRGPSPLEVKLNADVAEGVLDINRAHGARIVLA
jgi:hypothetical protein